MDLSFESSRLKVSEVQRETLSQRPALLERIPQILTPSVVENLPAHFHNIDSKELAEAWLERMLSDSRLFLVKSAGETIIGFLFAFVENECEAHIGYLLAKECWGKGLASELLQSFIAHVAKNEPWIKLVGGVEQSNVASANLLKKLGFVAQSVNDSRVTFYEFTIPRPPLGKR